MIRESRTAVSDPVDCGGGRASSRRCAGAAASPHGPARAGALFHYSLLYLALLFVAMAVDAALTSPIT